MLDRVCQTENFSGVRVQVDFWWSLGDYQVMFGLSVVELGLDVDVRVYEWYRLTLQMAGA